VTRPNNPNTARDRLLLFAAAVLPVAGGPGGVDGAPTAGVFPGPLTVDVGEPAATVTVAGADGVVVPVAEADGEPVGTAVVERVDEAVGEPVGTAVVDAVGVTVEAIMSFVTVAWQVTSAPPPLPEPLHWSTFTKSDAVIVDGPVTEQTKPTLVPPLPEPLHWPTVAWDTEVTPAVLAGVQVPGAPVPVITDPTHWYTVAAVIAAGLALKWLEIVTVQTTVPPPPLPEPLHCWTVATGSDDVVVMVAHVSVLMGPEAPTHLVIVTVEGGEAESAPPAVR
jgi:hypothetical protein